MNIRPSLINRDIIALALRSLILSGPFLFFIFILPAKADTLYLKNGRQIEGIIKSQDDEYIELEVGFGAVKFIRGQVARIYKSTPEEARALQEEWRKRQLQAEAEKEKRYLEAAEEKEKRRLEAEEKKEKLTEKLEPQQVEVRQESAHLSVDAVINKKVPALLILDTGASLVVLSENIAQKLGIDTKNKDVMVELQLADGRAANAKYVVLESINVQGLETKNVEAAVLLGDTTDYPFQDGLLGMSFLSRFNFRVDQKNKKLILEKAK